MSTQDATLLGRYRYGDPRDQEQQDLGFDLACRLRIRRKWLARERAKRARRIEAQQAEARARWTPSLRVVEGGR